MRKDYAKTAIAELPTWHSSLSACRRRNVFTACCLAEGRSPIIVGNMALSSFVTLFLTMLIQGGTVQGTEKYNFLGTSVGQTYVRRANIKFTEIRPMTDPLTTIFLNRRLEEITIPETGIYWISLL
ncbi:hypothetical protein BaRGS_00022221, partial [Batillaria attramentaria]